MRFICVKDGSHIYETEGKSLLPHTKNYATVIGPLQHYKTAYMLLFLRDWVANFQSDLSEERVDDLIRYIAFCVLYETSNYY